VAERTPVRSVWFARGMGFLEDAIREHLELKRQQGADPAELAQKEFEALAPVVPEEPATWGHEPDPAVQGFAAEFDGPQMDAPQPDAPQPAEAVQEMSLEARAAEFSAVGQETAELDMREVFGFDGSMDSSGYPEGLGDHTPVRAARISDRSASEEMDWQVATARALSDSAAEIIPGQESLTFE
jgi:hypothetical protein